MIFWRSIVKLMAFAQAPSVLAHELCNRIRLRQRGKCKYPEFGRRCYTALIHRGLDQGGRSPEADVHSAFPLQQSCLFGTLEGDYVREFGTRRRRNLSGPTLT